MDKAQVKYVLTRPEVTEGGPTNPNLIQGVPSEETDILKFQFLLPS